MSFDLTILQKPLDVCPSHSDHTWNVSLNDYSAYTDIRLVVDVYSNPYSNDWGTNQISKKQCRLLIPVNEYGNCIFNVETLIRNFVVGNPRNMTYQYNPFGPFGTISPYEVQTIQSLIATTRTTSQATIVNDRPNTIGFSNGFNGGYTGFQNLYHINEYRCIFGVQYTNTGGTTTLEINTTDYDVYSGWTGQSLNPLSAATQPYGITIWPGIQDNKIYGVSNLSAFTYYYSGTNLTGQYNYLNTKIFDYAMLQTGSTPFNQYGLFMATYGDETLPMTAFGGSVNRTRYRTHYYKCPILVPFMFGENQLYDNSDVVESITYLTKANSHNGQMNYDQADNQNIQPISGSTYLSPLGSRIAYGIYKHIQDQANELSDVAIFLSSGTCDPSGSERVSEIVQYKMVGKECLNDPYCFLFMNRQGVWDTYTFTKKSQKTYQPEQRRYASYKSLNTPYWNRQSYDSAETTFYGKSVELFTFDSGYVHQNDGIVIEELMQSPYLFMIMDNYFTDAELNCGNSFFNPANIFPYLIPCVILNKDVKVFQQKYQRIFQYTLEVKQTPYRQYDLPY